MKIPLIDNRPSRHTLFQQVLPLGLLGRTLRVHPGEWRLLAWVTAIQLVMSASSILINNTAQTTFIKRFGVDALPMVFLSEALITFFVAGLVSVLMERYRSLRVFTGLLIFYGIAAGIIRILVGTGVLWAYPILYIMKSQAVSVLPILYWDILGDLFTTQQSKRLYTLITAGGVLGTAAGSLLTHSVALWIGTENILLLFMAGMGVAALLNSLTDRVAGAPVQPYSASANKRPAMAYGQMAREFIAFAGQSRLLRYMIVLLAIPNMLLPIMDYQFNVLVDQHFVSEETTLRFFGIFRAVANTFIFFCLLISSRLISKWGVPVSMLFHPVNYVLAFGGILLRFDIISGLYARFTTEVLKTVFNNPARAILYNFFPERLRSTVRVVLRGGVIRLSDFAGSGLLILVSGSIAPRQLSLIAIPLALVWVATSFRLKRAYPSILVQTIAEQQVDLEPMTDDQLGMLAGSRGSRETINRGIASSDAQTVRHCAQLLVRIKPPGWLERLLEAILSKNEDTQHDLLSLLSEDDVRQHLPRLYAMVPRIPADRQWVWLDALTRLDPDGSGPFLEQFTTHSDPRARMAASVGRGRSGNPAHRQAFREHVRHLLGGDGKQLREAMNLVAKVGDREFEKLLLDGLSSIEDPQIVGWVLDGLVRMGSDALQQRAGDLTAHESPLVRLKALDTLCNLGHQAPLDRIVGMLRDPEPSIRDRAAAFIETIGPGAAHVLLHALTEPSRRQRKEIFRIFEHMKLPGVMLSRFAIAELKQAYRFLDLARSLKALPNGPLPVLLQAYLEEKQADKVEIVLHALGTIVFGKRIRVIIRALNADNPRERDNALEALDNALHGDFRRSLLPLLAGRSLQEKLAQSKRLPKDWFIPALSAKKALSAILGTSDPVLRALGLEVVQENRGITADITVPAARSRPIRILYDVYDLSQHWVSVSLSLNRCIRHLRGMPLFHGLKIGELVDIVEQAQWVAADGGEYLLRAGNANDTVYVVAEGRLRAADGHPAFEWSSGDIVGEFTCLSGGVDAISVQIEMTALLIALPCDVFQRIILHYPAIALNLCSIYSRMIKRFHQQMLCS